MDYLFDSATSLLQRIHRRELTSLEVTRACLDRIAAVDGRLNAVPTVLRRQALAAARKADLALDRDGPTQLLQGLPMTLKDATRLAGVRTTYGIPMLSHYKPRTDSAVSAALRAAGAIIIGRTNVPIYSFDWQCESPIFGLTHNPWDVSRTCGGSSGGAAAALAAGMTPLEIGSDVGGSIRYPAHCCGVYGLRPSDDLVSNEGTLPPLVKNSWQHSLVNGPLARSMEDLDLGLRAVADPQRHAALSREPDGGRIAYATSFGFVAAGSETRDMIEAFVAGLPALGLTVTEAAPELDMETAFHLWGRMAGTESISFYPAVFRTRLLRQIISSSFRWTFWKNSRVVDSYVEGLRRSRDSDSYRDDMALREHLQAQYQSFYRDHDFWITPVSPGEAILHQKIGHPIPFEGRSWDYSVFLSGFLLPTSILGTPTLTFPIGVARSGLPIAVQIHGAMGDDLRLLALGRRLQEHFPLPQPGPRMTA